MPNLFIFPQVFANPEDAKGARGKVGVDEDVERSRRAHLNDMENIYLFLLNAAIYVLTGPSYTIALNLFRAFTAARYLHTFFYVNQVSK